mmetsp:Transcript_489/g.752  ORF Transcript_489/g.752 Transcript_489/m.752 type:complete len:209 (+) Transcript_489:849-1475(+)
MSCIEDPSSVAPPTSNSSKGLTLPNKSPKSSSPSIKSPPTFVFVFCDLLLLSLLLLLWLSVSAGIVLGFIVVVVEGVLSALLNVDCDDDCIALPLVSIMFFGGNGGTNLVGSICMYGNGDPPPSLSVFSVLYFALVLIPFVSSMAVEELSSASLDDFCSSLPFSIFVDVSMVEAVSFLAVVKLVASSVVVVGMSFSDTFPFPSSFFCG